MIRGGIPQWRIYWYGQSDSSYQVVFIHELMRGRKNEDTFRVRRPGRIFAMTENISYDRFHTYLSDSVMYFEIELGKTLSPN